MTTASKKYSKEFKLEQFGRIRMVNEQSRNLSEN